MLCYIVYLGWIGLQAAADIHLLEDDFDACNDQNSLIQKRIFGYFREHPSIRPICLPVCPSVFKAESLSLKNHRVI